jgi:hypothetical protein
MHILYVATRKDQIRSNDVIKDAFCDFKCMIIKRNSEQTQNVDSPTQRLRSRLFVRVNQSSQQSYPQACGKLLNLKNNPQVSRDCDVSL